MGAEIHALDIGIILVVAAFGLCLGSFATAMIYRIPRNISWIHESSKATRSKCTSCATTLTVFDLVPLFSWLAARGKCRHCNHRVSFTYPLIELTTMVLVLLLYWVWGFTASAFPILLAVPFLLAALIIDWKEMILPDSLNIALGILAAIYVIITWGEAGWDYRVLANHVLAAILLVAVFAFVSGILGKLKGRPALGLGDLKFLAPAGLFLGMPALPSYMALGGLLGLVTAILKGALREKGAFPFGPALIISFYIHVFLTGLGFDYTW